MFHKGKRRRLFIAFAQADPEASSFDSISELTRIATSFEPARFDLDDQPEASADRDEPRGLKSSGTGPAPAHTVSEAPTGERVFHFGCYASATRFDLERKIATPAHPRQEATHERIER